MGFFINKISQTLLKENTFYKLVFISEKVNLKATLLSPYVSAIA